MVRDTQKAFDSRRRCPAIILLAAEATEGSDGGTGRRKRRSDERKFASMTEADKFRDQGHVIRI